MVLAKFTAVILIGIFISSVDFINARNVTSIKTLVTFESGTKLMESSNNDGHFEVSGRANSSEYPTNTNLIAKRKLAELNGGDTNIYAKSKHNNKRKNNVFNTRHHSDSYGLKIVRKRETNATVANVTSHYDDELLLDDVTGLNNTNCSNDYCISDEDYLSMIDDYMFPTSYEWLLIVLHSMVFLIGLVGNALVCVAVYRNHSMRTVTNYFIVNLAVADFMVILFCLPPTVLWDVTETWFMGDAMCKVVLYIQTEKLPKNSILYMAAFK
ncbi:SIFamide receptor [Carabus blaptoides fortunei]